MKYFTPKISRIFAPLKTAHLAALISGIAVVVVVTVQDHKKPNITEKKIKGKNVKKFSIALLFLIFVCTDKNNRRLLAGRVSVRLRCDVALRCDLQRSTRACCTCDCAMHCTRRDSSFISDTDSSLIQYQHLTNVLHRIFIHAATSTVIISIVIIN